jgi:hypothetical protein
VPLDRVTVVCVDPGPEPPPDAIACDDAAELALGALGDDRIGSIRRLDVGLGANGARDVVARSASFETLEVRITRDPSGELVASAVTEGRPMPPPLFDAPAARAPDIPGNPPASIRERRPLAFCGREDQAGPDAFDAAARACFVAGITAWTPVELVVRAFAFANPPITTVYRYTGAGGIQRAVDADGRWTGFTCAISPIATPAAFLIVAPCMPVDLGP